MKTLLCLASIIMASAVSSQGGTALRFDGINDYGSVPDSDALSPQAVNGQMTISVWVKMDSLPSGSGQTIVTKSSEYQNEYNVGIQPSGSVGFNIWRPTGSNYTDSFGGYLTPGRWHNITGTFVLNQYIKTYLDGALVASSSYFNPPMGGNGSGLFYFGKTDNPSTPWWYKGALDNVSLWNYAMSDSQVQNLYSTPLVGSEQGLIACWNFDEASGQIVNDLTGNGHNGTLGSSTGVDTSDPTWVAGTPEPCTMLLLGLGGIAIGRIRK